MGEKHKIAYGVKLVLQMERINKAHRVKFELVDIQGRLVVVTSHLRFGDKDKCMSVKK